MKLAIITALHERYGLTELFLRYWQDMTIEGVELLLSCAVTTTEYKMRELVDGFPMWHPVYAENKPLVKKFAANMKNVRRWKPDAMMIMGSDDFANEAYIRKGLSMLDEGDFVGGKQIHYLNLGTEQMITIKTGSAYPVGAGRFFSMDLLKAMDWQPWVRGCEKVDAGITRNLNRLNVGITWLPDYETFGGAILDVKAKNAYGHEINQTPFRVVRKWNCQQVNARRYLGEYFPSIKDVLIK